MRKILYPLTALGLSVFAPASAGDLTLKRSLDLAQAAIASCAAKGAAVSASVVDAKGIVIVVLRADGAPKAPVAAPRKAATAVAFNQPGSVMEPREKTDAAFAAEIAAHPDLYNAHGGSLPLYDASGALIGGLAVADTSHEMADQCARSALEIPATK
jgi:uncharacterized protein GlcG (DUF336 family)